MKHYTIENILAWGPCDEYTDDDASLLRELFGRRKSVTLLQILCDGRIPDDDGIWVGIAAMDDCQRRLYACDCAESVLHIADDSRCDAVVAVARKFALGEATKEELASARESAWYSAKDSAWDNDWESARDSTWDSARDSAWDSARDSAWGNAWDNDWESARADQRQALITLALAGEIE